MDPVRWLVAQATPAVADPPAPATAQGEREAPPSWWATVFPFIGSGEPVGFAPARWGGTVAFEYLAHHSDGARRRDLVLGSVNLNASSYFWKPWFAQVEGTATVLLTGQRGEDTGERGGFTPSTSLSGGGTLTVFPNSRFPFLASANTTDSRATGEFASGDYRSTRATLRQTYRDPAGTSTYVGSFDYSLLSSDAFGRDTVAQLEGRYLRTLDPHRIDAVMAWSRNRQDSGAESDIFRAYSSHLYTPTSELWVTSLANFSESQLATGPGGTLRQRIGQLTSQAIWRPESDERLTLSGGGRLFATQIASNGSGPTATSVAGNVGASFALTPETSLNAAVSATQVDVAGGDAALVTMETAGATYTSRPFELGFASYSISTALAGAHEAGGPEGTRSGASVQADQQLSRTLALGPEASLNLTLTQGGGVIEDSLLGRTDQVRAGVAAGLRMATSASSEAYLGASYSGSNSRGGLTDRFRLGNVQASGQLRFGPHDSTSANITAQWVRSNRDAFDAEESTRQVYGGLSYQHSRLFGLPRLRYLLSATFNQGIQTSSRLLGDVDATRENVTRLVDSRLLYDIGRLEIRVGTRIAKIDGRDSLQWYLRIQRYIGQY